MTTTPDRHTTIAHGMLINDIANLFDELGDRGLAALTDSINANALRMMALGIHDSRRARLTDDDAELPAALLTLDGDDASAELAAYCDTDDAPACCCAAKLVIDSIYTAAGYKN